VLGVVVAILTLVLRSILSGKVRLESGGLPPIPKALQEKVARAEEDNLRERILAKSKADGDRKDIDDIMKIDDGAERRKRFAEKLGKL
jgi:hypothetical protein